jgi:hypothetical protein
MATRCCCPPDSCSGLSLRLVGEANFVQHLPCELPRLADPDSLLLDTAVHHPIAAFAPARFAQADAVSETRSSLLQPAG